MTAGTNLTVLKTTVGSAQSVAVAIDTARWPEVVGTISGDDTIFIATAGARAQRKLGERLRAFSDAKPHDTDLNRRALRPFCWHFPAAWTPRSACPGSRTPIGGR
jgi:hypothetical protein